MRLTRRDALFAIAGLSGVGAAAGSVLEGGDSDPITDAHVATLRSAAEVIYPSSVTVEEDFVRRYVTGRSEGRPAYRAGMEEGVELIEGAANEWCGEEFVSLPVGRRESVLRRMGLDRVPAKEDGRAMERVRYYVINDMLYALYSTPLGGALLGRSNPQGYPGGLEAYQRGPE